MLTKGTLGCSMYTNNTSSKEDMVTVKRNYCRMLCALGKVGKQRMALKDEQLMAIQGL